MFHTSLRSQLKNSCFVFHQGFQTPRTIKQLRLQRRAFICFSVFGTPDEKLAFVSSFVVTDIVGFVCLLKNREKFTPRIQPLYIRRSTYRILASFRLDYEYEIEYECDFSILVFRLHIITTHIHFIP